MFSDFLTLGTAAMAEKKRKGGGGKLARTENVQVRLDPKLRFAAELAAGKERRTLSSFIEWAVERAVKEVGMTRDKEGKPISAAEVADTVWGSYEADRLVGMATHYPELLTHEEQSLWKYIQEEKVLWESGNIDMPLLRKFWGIIVLNAKNTISGTRELLERFAKLTPKDRDIITMRFIDALAAAGFDEFKEYHECDFQTLTISEIEEFKKSHPVVLSLTPAQLEACQKESMNKSETGSDHGA
jgi:hypothetical protein